MPNPKTFIPLVKAVFEINEGIHHDHLICMECGEVVEFIDEEIERRQEKIATKRGFTLKNHSLVLYGSCQKCESKLGT